MAKYKNNKTPNYMYAAFLESLTPEEVAAMSTNEFIYTLIDNNIIETTQDARLIILEKLNEMLQNDDAFPVHYYKDNEPFPDDRRIVDDVECLTDEYIDRNMK